ncbi:MAG: patatin, partial [Eudoraea sp.]
VIERPRKDNFVFPGLKEAELPVTQFMMIKLSMQYNVVGGLFLTPHVNLSTVGFNDFDTYFKSAFSPKGNWNETTEASTLFSAGLTTSFKSFLGPIDFDVSYVNDIEKARIFFGVGLQFNRSK